jgi:hypothetical protein
MSKPEAVLYAIGLMIAIALAIWSIHGGYYLTA